MSQKESVRVVLCTCPSDAASGLARTLLEERLVACVNIVGGVSSLYRWKGEIAEDEESMLVIKTTPACYSALEARLQALHPYDVPEVLALDTDGGSDAYLAWARAAVA